ncbi:MAG: hypothetical protein ACOCM8_10295, partial [Acetivibrio ethanolgignens]
IDKKAALKWSSKKKSVATVSKKGVVKAVKAGTTKISCKITTKNKKKYTLTCTVTVKKPTAKNISKTVSTQKELETALKTKNLTKLTIQTEDEITFTIPEGSYNKVALTVDAPKADIVNFGKFKSINIKAIKADTWKENASGNTIKITAIDARIVVEAGAVLANVSVTQDGGKVKIEAAGTIDTIEISAPIIVDLVVDGKVGEVAVKAAAVVSVEGNTTEAVPIKVSEAATGTTLSSSTPVEVEAATDISLTLAKGAEGSKVEVTGETTQIAVKNDTAEAVKVTTPAGTQEVAKDTSSKVNTDGSISGTTTTNPGYIYSSPDPLAMSTIMVKSTTEIAVYFNQTVPAGVAVENINIKNADGEVQDIKEVSRHSHDTQAYFIEFSDTLATGTYTVAMAVSGKQFEGNFDYDASVWEPLDAAKGIVLALMESGLTVSSSGLQSNEICRQAFEKELEEKIKVDPKASVIDKLSVQTRPFKYEESYPDANPVLQPDKMVCIWVGGYKGDANFMWDAFVKFTCTGEAIVVSAPKVNEMKLKNSIVVQFEQGYEYACAKEGVVYKDISDDAWISRADNMGNCELKGLETNAAYIVYKRMVDAPELYATAKVTLTADAPEIICVASASRTTYEAGTVTSGSAITFSVPTGIVTGNYGNITQNEELCGMLTMDEKAINGSNWRIKDQNLIVTLPWDEEKFNKGTIILKYTYRCIVRESGIPVAESAPIEFTIKFTIK